MAQHVHIVRIDVNNITDLFQQSIGGLKLRSKFFGDALICSDFEDLRRHVLLDQLGRRAFGQDFAIIHDHQTVAKLGSFIHVMSGKHQGYTLAAKLPQFLPHQMARLGVQPCRRFIQYEQPGFVQHGPPDKQSPLHSPG